MVLRCGDGFGHEEERLEPGWDAMDNGGALIASFIGS
jgi:hypothetical protein